MDWLKLCLVLCSIIVSCESANDYFVVIAPNVIRFNHPETVVISIFGKQQNVQVSVWLQHRGKSFSDKQETVLSEENPVNTTIIVTEADLFNTVIDDKPRIIQLCAGRTPTVEMCKDIVISYKTGYLIVQTDKPIYTPRQKVKIRVLALDESLQKVSADQWPIYMDIVSPSNLTLGRRVFTKTESTGFYKNVFTLPPYPELGMWTARAFYGGQYETLVRSSFQVDEYVLPTFGVTVEASKLYILESDSNVKIDFTVIAKYVYGKPVAGTARLAFNITDEAGNSRYLISLKRQQLENGVGEFGIKVGELLNSGALKNEGFPDTCRLDVVATVFESATGKEESTLHDDIVFATEPYIFKFTRSKRYFRPGMEYYFKIDMFTPNNVPISGMKIDVWKLDENDQLIEKEDVETDHRGRALAIFQTTQTKSLKFKVITNGYSPSNKFEVFPYDDKNQIQVERIITDDNVMRMNAFTNMQVASSRSNYTGMLFLIVTRGKVVRVVFKQASNKAGEELEESLQELITPSARLLVFYVDKGSNNVVADSIKIEVDAKCRGTELSLTTRDGNKEPAAMDKLTITGTPRSWVGLSAIDKALLLLNDKSILMKNKMFDALRAHDLGCGEGSGKNNGDVFKNAGILILTNANVSPDLHRSTEECHHPETRKKRSADECNGSHNNCCVYGNWYAEKVFNETSKDAKAKLDSYTLCYAAAKKAFETKVSPNINCTVAILHTCTRRMDVMISSVTQIVSKSLDDISHYEADLNRLDKQHRPHKRKDFRESFLFDEVYLDDSGKADKSYNYPDSITTWMIQAIGITENHGMCIADPVDVKVFRDFFIQLDLPYKATRYELFDIKATLFYYGVQGDKPKPARMYMEAVDGLCYGSEPGKPSEKVVHVGPNTATTVRFPMVPLKAGSFDVTISAFLFHSGASMVDIIKKPLLVVNEGIQEIITIQVCLDPNQQREDCEDHEKVKTQYIKQPGTGIMEQSSEIDLILPDIAIQGTGSATAYLQGNIMDNVIKTIISGVDSLFKRPYGCGEQTIASTAPNVYAMMYLKQTKQVTADIEATGNRNIRDGVDREKSMFRHPDGSYSCCNNKFGRYHRATSVWLTAFVAKVFCHANSIVDSLLNEKVDLHPTIMFLKKHMNDKGQFKEIKDTASGSWLKGATETGNTPSLTAFVLISLLECNSLQKDLKTTIDRAVNYLEQSDFTWLKNRPFDLAIITYALALAKSEQKWNFKNALDSIKKTSGKNVYWANPISNKVDSYAIETTAYALLAMLQFNDMKSAGHIVRWLTSHQNAQGLFKSTQDTVVGLQALSQYSIRTYSPEVDLQLSFTANKWHPRQIAVKNEKFQRQIIVDKLPVEIGDSKLNVLVSGTSGTGRMRIELRYNRPAKDDEICPFDISDIEVDDVYKLPSEKEISKLGKCDVCGRCTADSPNPNYSLLTTPTPVNITTASNVNRKKRQASRGIVDNSKCIRFSVRAKPGNQHGMSMIYFNLETDVTVFKEDMEKVIQNNDNMDDYEMPTDQKGFVVFYLNTLTSHKNDFVFRLVDNFEGDKNTRQPVSVDVFDYYDPDKYCRKIYGTGVNKGAAVSYDCDSKTKQCRCLKNACPNPIEKEIEEMFDKKQKPAVKMVRYTCNSDKANFADIVKIITNVSEDEASKNKMVIANVKTAVHRGAYRHEAGDKLTFFWKTTCPFPKFEIGKEYLIIAKDGFRRQIKDGEDEYHYSLMDTALVIGNKSRKVRRVKNAYAMLMKRQGCSHK